MKLAGFYYHFFFFLLSFSFFSCRALQQNNQSLSEETRTLIEGSEFPFSKDDVIKIKIVNGQALDESATVIFYGYTLGFAVSNGIKDDDFVTELKGLGPKVTLPMFREEFKNVEIGKEVEIDGESLIQNCSSRTRCSLHLYVVPSSGKSMGVDTPYGRSLLTVSAFRANQELILTGTSGGDVDVLKDSRGRLHNRIGYQIAVIPQARKNSFIWPKFNDEVLAAEFLKKGANNLELGFVAGNDASADVCLEASILEQDFSFPLGEVCSHGLGKEGPKNSFLIATSPEKLEAVLKTVSQSGKSITRNPMLLIRLSQQDNSKNFEEKKIPIADLLSEKSSSVVNESKHPFENPIKASVFVRFKTLAEKLP